jgi:hypothetical protein
LPLKVTRVADSQSNALAIEAARPCCCWHFAMHTDAKDTVCCIRSALTLKLRFVSNGMITSLILYILNLIVLNCIKNHPSFQQKILKVIWSQNIVHLGKEKGGNFALSF